MHRTNNFDDFRRLNPTVFNQNYLPPDKVSYVEDNRELKPLGYITPGVTPRRQNPRITQENLRYSTPQRCVTPSNYIGPENYRQTNRQNLPYAAPIRSYQNSITHTPNHFNNMPSRIITDPLSTSSFVNNYPSHQAFAIPQNLNVSVENIWSTPTVCIYKKINSHFPGGLACLYLFCVAYNIQYKISTDFNSALSKLNNFEMDEFAFLYYDNDHIIQINNMFFTSVIGAIEYLSLAIRPVSKEVSQIYQREVTNRMEVWLYFISNLAANPDQVMDESILLNVYFGKCKIEIYQKLNTLLNHYVFACGRKLTWPDFLIGGLIYNDFIIDALYIDKSSQDTSTNILLKNNPNILRFWTNFVRICKPAANWMEKVDAELSNMACSYENSKRTNERSTSTSSKENKFLDSNLDRTINQI